MGEEKLISRHAIVCAMRTPSLSKKKQGGESDKGRLALAIYPTTIFTTYGKCGISNIYSRTSSGARCLSRRSGRGGRGRLCNGGRSGLVSDGSREFSQTIGEWKLMIRQAHLCLSLIHI